MVKKGRSPDTKQVNGLLNLFKPAGITSMEAVRRIKRMAGRGQKVGHGGTMDPMAQGVLPICLGQATRLMEYVVDGRKRYLMTVHLGVTTDTYDAEGETVATGDATGLTPEAVESVLMSFVGSIDQTPPMYSAVKVKGQRLYQLARAGQEVERAPRPVKIFSIKVTEWALPRIVVEVESGPGVYMRSLAHDLGQILGCGGHVASLERQYCGGFEATDSVTQEILEAAAEEPGGWQQHVFPSDWVLRDLKSTVVGAAAENYLKNGQPVAVRTPLMDAGYLEEFRAYSADGRFLGVVRFDRGTSTLKPIKVFHIDQPSPYAPAASTP